MKMRVITGLANRTLRALGVAVVLVSVRLASASMFYVSNGGDGTVQVVTTTGLHSTYATGLSTPRGLAFDSSNNLYVANAGDGTIRKITPDGTSSIFASGLTGDLYGVAINSATGNIYVSDANTSDTTNSSILQFTPAGAMTVFATVNAPGGLVFDLNHNLFATIATAGTGGSATGGINEISPAGGVTTILSTGLADPIGLAMSSTGDLYADEFAGSMRVMRVTTGGTETVFATGVGTPYGDVFGPDGRLYVADFADGSIIAVSSGGVVSPFSSGFASPRFITLGPDASAIPEPGAICLLALGAGAMLLRKLHPHSRGRTV